MRGPPGDAQTSRGSKEFGIIHDGFGIDMADVRERKRRMVPERHVYDNSQITASRKTTHCRSTGLVRSRRLSRLHIDGSTGKRPLTPVPRLMNPPW